MNDCKERILPACDKVIQEAGVVGNCPSWSVCLPFGGNLRTEGGCIHYDAPQSVPEDGEYSRIVIANGCIVDAKKAEIPLYTSSPCAPVPAPCDCGGGSESLPDPSPQAGNLFRYDVTGRPLVKLTVSNGSGISITGDGTASNPLVITNTQEEKDSGHIRSGSSVIKITGTGTTADPTTISHAEGKQGTFNGLTFDEYGHLVDYEEAAAKGVTGLVGMGGIDAQTDTKTGVATIQLADPAIKAEGSYYFGGYTVDVDDKNRITSVKKSIDVTTGVYAFGPYNVSVNSLGSIDELTNTYNSGTEYSKYFEEEGVGESSRSGVLILRTDCYVRIVYEGPGTSAIRSALSFRIDGRTMATAYSALVGSTVHAEAVSQGVMAAGQHTIQVVLSGQTFTAGQAKLVVTPTWPFES